MSNDTEIDTVVSAFVADLAELVRRMALDAVQHAFRGEMGTAKRERREGTTAAPRSAGKPAPPAAPLPPAPARETNLLSFLPVLAKREEAPRVVAPLPVPRRFPPKRTRTRNPKPAAPPPEPAPAAEAQSGESPARKWVVVRRRAAEGAMSPSTEAAPPVTAKPSASPVPAAPAASLGATGDKLPNSAEGSVAPAGAGMGGLPPSQPESPPAMP